MSSGAPWDDPAEDQTAPELEPELEAPDTAGIDYTTGEAGEDPEGPHECPECGKRFKMAMHRGLHRRLKHGVAGQSRKDRTPSRGGARRSRSSSSSTSDPGGGPSSSSSGGESRRRKAIKDTLFELADLADSALGYRGPALERLPEIVRRDADRQAAAIAGLASRVEPLGALIDVVFGAGGPLSFLLAFGPTVRKLRQLWTERRQAAEQAAWDHLQEVPAEGLELGPQPDWTQG